MNRAKSKILKVLVISVGVFLISVALHFFTNIFTFLENQSYDLRVRLFADRARPSEQISVVVLDQDSLDWAAQELGWAWPWPRSAYGDIVRYFNLGSAYSVTFDVLYTEPSVYGVDDDLDFAEASEDFGGVVQTVFFSNQYGNTDVWPEDTKKSLFKLSADTYKFFLDKNSDKTALFPISEIRKSASSVGNISSTTDSDGVIRRYTFFDTFDSYVVPSLALSAYTAREIEDVYFDYDTDLEKTIIKDRTMPATPSQGVLLRYRKSIDSYIPYSARDILESYYAVQNDEEPLLDPSSFNDSYVFFSFYAPGLFDIGATPISTTYPGAGVHITALDNLLQNDFIIPIPVYSVVCMILLASLFGCVFQQISFRASIICVPLGAIILTACVGYSYVFGYHVPYVVLLFSLVLSFTVSLLVSYNTEYKQKRYINSVFKQYLSPAVIERLIDNPDQVKLGGEQRELSIFFSDLEGFTSISEKLTPEKLTEFLNEYLSAMTDIILDSGGTIDKYEGDAIIAFWNAPLNQEDHSKRAIEAAVLCQNRLKDMNSQLKILAGTDVKMRIGINTGLAVVGNMGSKSRFDYTMIGDTVNLCARLESLNKQFGTYTMCSEITMNEALRFGSNLKYRELAKVMVVGKKEAVRVFEPVNNDEFENKRLQLNTFSQGLELFYNKKVKEAITIFESIENSDGVAKKYALKCRQLLEKEDATIDGVWRATEK